MPATALPMDRPTLLQRLRSTDRYDLIVIGGGATGLGVALDAAARGHRVALLEAQDFAKGTSSRSTKLVHGGVRYLAQGKLGLVREALHERATLLANAPHLARPLPFVMPGYRFWERPWYGLGLKMYDALAGSRGLGATQLLSSAEVLDRLPGVRANGLHGGVRYWDAQFDDARLAVTLARTAWLQGAAVLNHCPVTALLHRRDDGAERVCGVRARDAESGESFELLADCVVNATGVWVDAVRDMDHAAAGEPPVRPMVSPSQGVHLVVDRSFLGGDHALLVPKTADGRVLFAVPWLGMTVLGTTDTPRGDLASEPTPFAEEVAFILGEAGRYLTKAPRREDVRSVWVGLRPLVRPDSDTPSTQAISREHAVRIGHSKLVTVTGGKWTTYRSMAEDVLARCSEAGLLAARPGGVTTRLPLAGAPAQARVALSQAPGEHLYGDDAALLRRLPGADRWLWRADGAGDEPHGLSEAMVRFAVRYEMARSLEDVLARRSRLLFLDAARAEALAEPVAAILAEELGRPIDGAGLAAFRDLAQRYRTLP